jgi:nitrogen fixation protein NifB
MRAIELMQKYANGPLNPQQPRPFIAAATMEGFLVNVHLGQAKEILIYQCTGEGGLKVIETRHTPDPGGGDQRWHALADLLSDCQALLVANAGPTPTQILARHGVKVICTEGLIAQAARQIIEGKTVPPPCNPRTCGVTCSGNAQGCA